MCKENEIYNKYGESKPSVFNEEFYEVVVGIGASELDTSYFFGIHAECVRSNAEILLAVHAEFCSNIAPYAFSPGNGAVGACLEAFEYAILNRGKRYEKNYRYDDKRKDERSIAPESKCEQEKKQRDPCDSGVCEDEKYHGGK